MGPTGNSNEYIYYAIHYETKNGQQNQMACEGTPVMFIGGAGEERYCSGSGDCSGCHELGKKPDNDPNQIPAIENRKKHAKFSTHNFMEIKSGDDLSSFEPGYIFVPDNLDPKTGDTTTETLLDVKSIEKVSIKTIGFEGNARLVSAKLVKTYTSSRLFYVGISSKKTDSSDDIVVIEKPTHVKDAYKWVKVDGKDKLELTKCTTDVWRGTIKGVDALFRKPQ